MKTLNQLILSLAMILLIFSWAAYVSQACMISPTEVLQVIHSHGGAR